MIDEVNLSYVKMRNAARAFCSPGRARASPPLALALTRRAVGRATAWRPSACAGDELLLDSIARGRASCNTRRAGRARGPLQHFYAWLGKMRAEARRSAARRRFAHEALAGALKAFCKACILVVGPARHGDGAVVELARFADLEQTVSDPHE